MARRDNEVVRVLLERYGRSYAAQAGIRLTDRAAPLYQLLVLATLLSARISSDIAVRAASELFKAGYRTPRAMRAARWQERVDALGRGHYRRYDERTASMLGDAAELLIRRWRGDLRRLRDQAGGKPSPIASLLAEFPGIGPAGAGIFLREAQAVWPSVSPYLDKRVLDSAGKAGLPVRPASLAALTSSSQELARLAAALIRVSRDKQEAAEIAKAAAER
jgi:endonuclease III